jgi:hypothetical protein
VLAGHEDCLERDAYATSIAAKSLTLRDKGGMDYMKALKLWRIEWASSVLSRDDGGWWNCC